MLHCSRHLHLELLVHLFTKSAPKEGHHKDTQIYQKNKHNYVEYPWKHNRDSRSRLTTTSLGLLQPQRSTHSRKELVFVANLYYVAVHDHKWNFVYLFELVSIVGHLSVQLRYLSICLVLTVTQELVYLTTYARRVDSQSIKYPISTLLAAKSVLVTLETVILEYLHICQKELWILFVYLVLPHILSHKHIRRPRIYLTTSLPYDDEQNDPPQAHDETNFEFYLHTCIWVQE